MPVVDQKILPSMNMCCVCTIRRGKDRGSAHVLKEGLATLKNPH